MSISYKESGVNIDAGNQLIDKIKPLALATKRLGVASELGGFGALFDLKKCNFKDPILVSSTDGVGTKLKIALALDKHDTIGIDLVAMSVNDLIVQGAEPLFFLDYFACSKLSVKTASEVIAGIAEGCKQANCALIGGETAEMPGIYQENEYDLAGFAVGAVERKLILPKATKAKDVLLGIKSSGTHSNGYSMIRHILKEKKIGLGHKIIDCDGTKKSLGEILIKPTKIYAKSCLAAIKTGKVKALSHITGGGLIENLPRVLTKGTSANINYNSWQVPAIFSWLQKQGQIKDQEMHRTFNCGIGMVLVCDQKNAEEIQDILQKNGEEVYRIGCLK
jgi:phosphoribosylformylglycinamidine cyclo-ligase